ncbi:Neurobeachin-like protein 2 [Pseudolycoriella hygida]|uniref:Neurobeachin-like protein 2 n=1 Tax=Pseudolycoriella hygida TaxID=35572 RepID=A0A9Q0MT05_9DIPT|nr:Neurobeachin-like protein 2 [Pseudolycoriella hygida]
MGSGVERIKPLHEGYQSEVSATLWEPLNTFWAECYEACKASSQKRAKQLMESRRKFQQKILVPWRLRQTDEVARLSSLSSTLKMKDNQTERRWKTMKRFLYGPRGAWCYE